MKYPEKKSNPYLEPKPLKTPKNTLSKTPKSIRIENKRESTVSTLLQNIADAKQGLAQVARTKSLVSLERITFDRRPS